MSSPDESQYSIDDNFTVGTVIAPALVEVDVISRFSPLTNLSVALMFTLAVILLIRLMLPICMAGVSIHKLGFAIE